MADPIVTPELIEAGAEALANHFYPPNGWSIAREEGKAVYRSSARALLTAVAPALEQRIDRARADELRKQAAPIRDAARQAGRHLDKARQNYEPDHVIEGLSTLWQERTRIAVTLERAADDRLSAPTEEN